ncbi:hypothetical protein ACIBL8_48495 [Streptomyces sp. NPDC050523]|uniref:hypothetical protein n=1 Tax=Streptomyces sp. NPDC050523 TaxID=3365622 RepID=UPI00379FDE8F
MRSLWGLDGTPAQATAGFLPTQARKDAPEWENHIRQRLHNLLKPSSSVSEPEARVLTDPEVDLLLKQEAEGNWHIDPNVPRASTVTAALADQDNANAMRSLWGLDGTPPQATARSLPVANAREDAPEWDKRIRKRLHGLLLPSSSVSEPEARVLTDPRVNLPLKQESEGNWHIDPNVPRASTIAAALADQDNANAIGKLWGLDGTPAQATASFLPTRTRKDAPEWENHIRQRLHNLLKPSSSVSEPEARVLTDPRVNLLLKQEEKGNRHIDPDVPRASNRARKRARMTEPAAAEPVTAATMTGSTIGMSTTAGDAPQPGHDPGAYGQSLGYGHATGQPATMPGWDAAPYTQQHGSLAPQGHPPYQPYQQVSQFSPPAVPGSGYTSQNGHGQQPTPAQPQSTQPSPPPTHPGGYKPRSGRGRRGSGH